MALKDIQVQKFFDRKKNKLLDIPFDLEYVTKNKTEINGSQSGAKVEPKWSQSQDKVEPNIYRSIVKLEPQLEPSKDSTEAKVESKWSQNKEKTLEGTNFSQLVGLQKKVIMCIYENCKISRCNESQQLTIDFINSYCKTTPCSIKKAIQRLTKKGCLIRKKFKDGRSGWTIYELPNYLYYEIIHTETKAKPESNWSQSRDKVEPQLKPQLEPTVSSGGCFLNILKTTTTGETEERYNQTIPKEWQLDIEPLTKIGFTATHLKQIASQNKLPPQHVQDSIYAFAFDLEKNDKAKKINGDPISYFMGILRNGRVYTFSSNYESPQDASMRLYLEGKRKLEKEREAMEKEAIDLAFNEWFVQLTEAQKREFLPEIFRNTPNLEKNTLLKNTALGHFKTEVWPSRRNEIFCHEVDKADKATGSVRPEEATEEEKKA